MDKMQRADGVIDVPVERTVHRLSWLAHPPFLFAGGPNARLGYLRQGKMRNSPGIKNRKAGWYA